MGFQRQLRWGNIMTLYKECFFKFGVEVGVEESIANEPLVTDFSNYRLKTRKK
jgi:hypothetical protein